MVRTGLLDINSGGTMGHAAIVKGAADRLQSMLSDECLIVTDGEVALFNCQDSCSHSVVRVPKSVHQLSVGGCIECVDTTSILLAVKKFGCDRVIFSTFFSTKLVQSMIAEDIQTILLTFPLRDSHWEAFSLRKHHDIFKQILVFADLYGTTRSLLNQTLISPFRETTPLSREVNPCPNKVLVLVGGGGRPSADILHRLSQETMLELETKSVDLKWSLSLGDQPKYSRTGDYWLEWRSGLEEWISDYDIIISEAGFNTTTELLSLGVPSILVPGHRRIDNQELRAVNYELLGCGFCCFPEEGPRGMAKRIYRFLEKDRAMQAAAQKSIDVALGLAKNPSIEEVLSS